MGFVEDVEVDEIMADDELFAATESDSQTFSPEEAMGYVSDEESAVLASKAQIVGFVSDDEGQSVVPEKGMSIFSNEGGDEKEEPVTLRPKLPFKARLDPFVRPKDEKWQKVENYFFSLLQAPGYSIEGIIEGTFDDHEITLITPQSGPPELVDWQRRNASRYFEHLEKRFKGATDTLAFKLTCLYFGFPVEPLRMGTMPFLLPPDPEPQGAKKTALQADPLGFLWKYDKGEESIYDQKVLRLRGGGASGYVFAAGEGNAIQEIPVEGYDMLDFDWTSLYNAGQETEKDVNLKSGPASAGSKIKKGQKLKEAKQAIAIDLINPPTPSKLAVKLDNAPKKQGEPTHLRLYSWQGAMDTRGITYADFVATADKVISNWTGLDRSVCVEIWSTNPVRLQQSVMGRIRHSLPTTLPGDSIWTAVRRYFLNGIYDDGQFACFIRPSDLEEVSDPERPGGYQPLSTDRNIIRIKNSLQGDVAYMRVPEKLYPEHKPHQFSIEYMLSMEFLLHPNPQHAWTVYQGGYIGNAYRQLDPPGGVWEQVINEQTEWSSQATITFTLQSIDSAEVPVIVPGSFTTSKPPVLKRKDFELTKSTYDGIGLRKLYEAVRLSLKTIDFQRECSGFEVWCPGPNFKDLTIEPTHIAFSGNITNLKSLEDWQGLLGSAELPQGGFALVVRPVFKHYHLQTVDGKKAQVTLNQYDLARFRAFVRGRMYKDYNPSDKSQVLVLTATNKESFQTELTVGHGTTEEEWLWIRRNIVDPDLHISIENLRNDWSISEGWTWGPRYVLRNHYIEYQKQHGGLEIKQEGPFCMSVPPPDDPPTPHDDGEDTAGPVDQVFKDSKNTIGEAERMKILRDRTFTSVHSIFTNPLKPVMPLHGPPLESLIRTGPSMPGVSIAMLTPTEVLRLQREVHSLRFQLLDRTRECPYADCDRYFTFGDAAGLDKHVREEHNILRCFLCDKNQHLIPYYNTKQIKGHFVSEHVDDILHAYGKAGVKAEKKCDYFSDCGAVTTHMDKQQLEGHMRTHESSSDVSDEDSSDTSDISDSLPESAESEETDSDTDLDMSGIEYDPDPAVKSSGQDDHDIDSVPKFNLTVPDSDESSSDTDLSLTPISLPDYTVKSTPSKLDKESPTKPAEKSEGVKSEGVKSEGVKSEGVKSEGVKSSDEKKPWADLYEQMTAKNNLYGKLYTPTGNGPYSPSNPLSSKDAWTDVPPATTPEPEEIHPQEALKQLLEKEKKEAAATKPSAQTATPPATGKKAPPPKPTKSTQAAQTQTKPLPGKKVPPPGVAKPAQTAQSTQTETTETTKPTPPTKKPVMVPVSDPLTHPNFSLFTAINPNYLTNTVRQNEEWIRDAVERHIRDGGKLPYAAPSKLDAAYAALRKVNPKPGGTIALDAAFIKERLDEFVALGGKLPLDARPQNLMPPDVPAPGGGFFNPQGHQGAVVSPQIDGIVAGAALAQAFEETNSAEGEKEKKQKRKRKRPASIDVDASGSEIYEYSERSAVSDPVADLAPEGEPSSKKQRRVDDSVGGLQAETKKKKKKQSLKPRDRPVKTRTGRTVKPSRVAREAADAVLSSSSDSSEGSGISTSAESSEFEYDPEKIEEQISKRKHTPLY